MGDAISEFHLQSRVLCARKSRGKARRSPRKTLGFLWDFSGECWAVKMQAEQLLRFGSYQLDLQTAQLWRGKQEVKLNPESSSGALPPGHTSRAGGDERGVISGRMARCRGQGCGADVVHPRTAPGVAR